MARPPAATLEQRKRSLYEWETLMRRYPLSSPWSLAWPVATALAGNLVVAWLVATGRMSPLELVLLVAIETALLVGVATLQARFVPKEAIQKNPMTVRDRLVTFAFGLVWLGLVYTLVFVGLVSQREEAERLVADPVAFLLSSNLKWPLLITLAGAFVDSLQDHAHYARHGGIFYSTPGMQAAARWMTLFLGGIPFFMPLVAVVGGLYALLVKTGEWLRARRGAQGQNLWMLATMPLMLLAFFATFAGLVASQVSGWAIGFATAKFAAEIFVVCLPLIASKAHAEESAGIHRVDGRKVQRLP